MSKIFRRSQVHQILGRQIMGLELCRMGLPYGGATGTFFPEDPDRMDMMFALVDKHPDIHIVSLLPDSGHMVNRYESHGDRFYLYRGIKDPEIEFTQEYRHDDYTEEEHAQAEASLEEFRNTPWSPVQMAGVNWVLDRLVKNKKS